MIFEDPTRRRWKVVVSTFAILTVVGIALTALFAASVLISPPLPSLLRLEKAQRTAVDIQAGASSSSVRSTAAQSSRRQRIDAIVPLASSGTSPLLPRDGSQVVLAFLVQSDPDSVTSFTEHKDSIDAVVPDWYTLRSSQCDVDEHVDSDVRTLLHDSGVSVFPRVTNGDATSWHTTEINSMLRNEETRTCIAGVLASFAKQENARGLNVDLETITASNRDNYLEFLIALARDLHAQGQLLTVDVTLHDPAYDMEEIGSIADVVVVMNYDEHYLSSPPGSIASQEWFDDNITEAMGSVPRNKLIVAMANYGDDWSDGKPTQSMTYAETMALADDSNSLPEMDPDSQTMHFQYLDIDGAMHDVWFLNSITAWNEYQTVQRQKTLGLGLWRLGSEDPTLWQFIDAQKTTAAILRMPSPLRSILYLSNGEIYSMRSAPHEGAVTLTINDHGLVDSAAYTTLPSGYLLERAGDEFPAKTVALTFDDGPDPTWTPPILDTLERLHVPAAFFVVGEQAERYPFLVERMAKDGFLVGNHTYLHPNISTISPERMKLELNSTQRIIEEAYGRKSLLFRSPYDTDSNPSEPDQLDPLITVSKLGYIIAGANIDPNDWDRPGVPTIVQRVEEQAQNSDNHVIVLHDGGGDRSQTLAALQLLIPALQKDGFRFIPLNEGMGLPSSALTPTLSSGEWFLVKNNQLMHTFLDDGWLVITWLFFFTTVLAIFRISFLGFLVLRSLRRSATATRNPHAPLPHVSILIPAYNEEKTITKTIRSVQSGLENITAEILVIDDGSKDGTAAIVRALAKEDPRIRLLSQKNGGKATALNNGLHSAKYDIVVTIDADTILFPNTIASLIAPFLDPSVDAVCGNVEVGNVNNLLTGFQALEYITTQNFDRRAFEALNCISVVPGATGAWRRKRILALGGYASDTLTEDADLTLLLLRHGGKIVYSPQARSRTEAPQTVSALAKQRFRWSFGTFQCLWKHRDMFFRGTLGWVALPNMFFFQILFPILSPIGDAVFLLSIIRGDMLAIAVGYFLFLFMDLCGSLLAFSLEQRPRKLMWLILIQRFFYRQFMYVVTFRSLIAILQGGHHGWNKLARQGNVQAQE